MAATGMVCRIPAECPCGYVDRTLTSLRWCWCCGDAICPGCFPRGHAGLDKCARCAREARPTGMEVAGRKVAEDRERKVLAEVLGGTPGGGGPVTR